MSGTNTPDQDYTPPWNIIQHESHRALPATMETIENAWVAGYNYITSPITNDHFHTRVLKLLSDHMTAISQDKSLSNLPAPIIPPFDAVDTPLTANLAANQLICHASSWIDISSPDPIVASISRQVLHMEVAYAGFCGIQTLIIPGPRVCNSSASACDGVARYARAIQEALAMAPGIFIAISLPMYSENQEPHLRPIMGDLGACCRPEFADSSADSSHELFGTWDAWNAIRTVCNYAPRLSVALEIPRQLPVQALMDRWYSEPLRSLSFTPQTFLRNKAGHPVLGKTHQALLTRYMRLRYAPFLLLCDVGPLPRIPEPAPETQPKADEVPALIGSPPLTPSPSKPLSSLSTTLSTLAHRPHTSSTGTGPSLKDQTAHLIYLRHLQFQQPPMSKIDTYAQSYQDYLQSPLQPLTDNLESVTYEVFEKDPVKYERYERAITLALADWKSQGKSVSGRGEAEGRVVVAVAGSGRGPLVTRALRAAKKNGMEIEMYALEKNPNAYVLLQRHNAEDPLWGGKVKVVKNDMRAWRGPILYGSTGSHCGHGKVDILISELLGSFGDNELSPECLDGVQHVLSPQGISIPANYTAHISPIAYPKAHQDILGKSSMDTHISDSSAAAVNSPGNTPYVVMLHAIDYLSKRQVGAQAGEGIIKQVWEFSHPLSEEVLRGSEKRRMGGVSGGGGGSMSGGDGANEHNSRYSRTTFAIQNRGLCHGLGGWFESVLYDGRRLVKDELGGETVVQGEIVELSTRPDTMEEKSKDMISWFPMFFPLKTPVYVPDDGEVDVSMWRQTDDRKVWYEWQVGTFINVGGGRRVRVGSSEVGSTRRGGCLM